MTCQQATAIFDKILSCFKKRNVNNEIILFLSLLQVYLRRGMGLPIDKLRELSFLHLERVSLSQLNKFSVRICEMYKGSFLSLNLNTDYSYLLRFQRGYLKLSNTFTSHLKKVISISKAPLQLFSEKKNFYISLHRKKLLNKCHTIKRLTKKNKVMKVGLFLVLEWDLFPNQYRSQWISSDKVELISDALMISPFTLKKVIHTLYRYE